MRLYELKTEPRPEELGDAYFSYKGKIVDIAPERNHRDWLLKNAEELGLPEYLSSKPNKALFESYKKGWVRIVWDEGGKWAHGRGTKQGNVLYLNGLDNYVWKNITKIMNYEKWAGLIDLVVIEYLDIVDEKPTWNRTDMFRDKQLEYLYKGRKPIRDWLPRGQYFTPESFYYNKIMNVLNERKNPIKKFNIIKTKFKF